MVVVGLDKELDARCYGRVLPIMDLTDCMVIVLDRATWAAVSDIERGMVG